MHLTRAARDRMILFVLFGGAVVLLVVALILRHNDSTSSPGNASGSLLEDRFSDQLALPEQSLPSKKEEAALKKSLRGPLTVASQRGTEHRVTIEATSNGTVFFAYLYRDGKGAGIDMRDSNFRTSRTVLGEGPAAKIAVQVRLDSTYASCAIYIDGKQADSATSTTSGDIVVCLA